MKVMSSPADVTSAEPGVPCEAEPPIRTAAPAYRRTLPWLAPGGALLLGWWSLATSPKPQEVEGLGLITLLPPGAWIALAVLFASFAFNAARGRFVSGLAALHVVALVLLLHGAPALLYEYPRFGTAWIHAGFIEHIEHTGGLLTDLDARFNWPGFFTGVAVLAKLAGVEDPVSLIAWFPVLINLAYALPLLAIGRAVSNDRRLPWIALWCFYLASWVGQDYLSPQATNFFLYLCLVAVLLTYFRRRSRRAEAQPSSGPRAWVGAWLSSWIGEAPASAATSAGQRVGLAALVAALAGASIVSHQLTPVIMVLAFGALATFRRTNLRGLTLLAGLALLAFISYATVPFWSTHLNDMFGGIGKVSNSVGSNVGDRVKGDSSHQLVIRVRLILTMIVWLVAAVSVLRRLRRRGVDPALIILAGVPAAILAMQSYGGEALLRVQLFTLPFMVLLLVLGFAPSPWNVRRVAAGTALLGVVSAVLAVGFYIARFGNESFEFMRPNEVEAMRWVYANTPPGSSLAIYDHTLPWQFRDVGLHPHLRFPHQLGQETRNLDAVTWPLRKNSAGGYLILSTGQDASGRENHGYREGWIWDMGRDLLALGDYQLVYSNADAWVLQVNPTRMAPPPAPIETPPDRTRGVLSPVPAA